MRSKGSWLIAAIVVAALAPGVAAAPADSRRVVDVELTWSSPVARPGDQRVLAVTLRFRDGFHANPDRERLPAGLEMLVPTHLGMSSEPAGIEAGPVQYPEPEPVPVAYAKDRATIPAYAGRVVLYLPVRVRRDAEAGTRRLNLQLTVQACDDRRCLPPARLARSAEMRVDPDRTATAPAAARPELFRDFDRSVFSSMGDQRRRVEFGAFGYGFSVDASGLSGGLLVLALGAVGGFLLNLTPCVLPVVPLKMMGLSQAAGSRGRCLALGASMAAGVVGFWVALGGAVLTFTGLTAANQLFQYPAFSTGIGLVIAAMGLAMMTGAGARLPLPRGLVFWEPDRETLGGAAALGVLTAVLSTPCTAPFMGATAFWATTQPPAAALLAFAAIGAGMASPYLLLAAFPGLIRRLPRSGPGSVLVKQVLGLLLLAAAVFFVGTGVQDLLGAGEAGPRVYWMGVAVVIAATGLWLGYRGWRIAHAWPGRTASGAVAALMVASGVSLGATMTRESPIGWVEYSPDRLAAARQAGKVVVLDFTAEWCLNCKWLERRELRQARVVEALGRPSVVPMKVDLTGGNPAGNRKLNELGRITIPLLAVFGRSPDPVFMSDAYTAGQVLAAIQKAQGRRPRNAESAHE